MGAPPRGGATDCSPLPSSDYQLPPSLPSRPQHQLLQAGPTSPNTPERALPRGDTSDHSHWMQSPPVHLSHGTRVPRPQQSAPLSKPVLQTNPSVIGGHIAA